MELPRFLEIGTHRLPLKIRRNKQARRICLRYNPTEHAVSLTLPQRVRLQEGYRFLSEKYDWLDKTLNDAPRQRKIRPGITIPILGNPHILRHDPTLRGSARYVRGELCVGGPYKTHAPRRLQDALKQIVRKEIHTLAAEKSKLLKKPHGRITIRDTKSRWGSCSSEGNLSFCWRLVFAPREVLEYVVAHEIAHLKHMNHSPAFWATVERLCPGYEAPKEWLRINAQELYQYRID